VVVVPLRKTGKEEERQGSVKRLCDHRRDHTILHKESERREEEKLEEGEAIAKTKNDCKWKKMKKKYVISR
jgi:hypothetical protein